MRRRCGARWAVLVLVAGLLGSPRAGITAPSPADDDSIATAQQTFNDGRYADAQQRVRRLLERAPNGPHNRQARFILLQCDVSLGALDEAASLLAQLKQDGGDETQDDIIFWEAEIARKRGAFAQARAGYEQIIQAHPQSPVLALARYSLGLAWYEEGRFTEAAHTFQETLDREQAGTMEADVQFMLGVSRYRLQQYREAAQWLRPLLDRTPPFGQRTAAHYYLGEASYYLNDWPSARAAYEAALTTQPDGPLAPYASYGLGWTLYQLQRPHEAQDALEHFLQLRPQDPLADSARYAAAQCARQQNDLDAAYRWFDDIIAHESTAEPAAQTWLDEAWLGKGEILVARGDRQGAITAYQQALQQLQGRAGTSALHQHVAELLTQGNRFEEAQREWTLAAEEITDAAQQRALWLRAGDAAVQQQRWPDAEAAYAKAVSGEPPSAYIAYVDYQHARVFHHQHRYTEAVAALQTLLTIHPHSAYADSAVAELAQVYTEMNQPETAAAQWQRLITQYPRSALVPQAYLAWGSLLMDRRRWVDASERFQALLRFFPDHPVAPQAVLLHAQSLQRLDRAADAEAFVRQYLERPLTPDAAIPLWLWLSQAAGQQGRWEAARAALQTILDRWPAHPQAAEALQALALIAEQTQQPDDAQRWWRRLVETCPHHPAAMEARIRLAETALAQAQTAAAHQWVDPVTRDVASTIDDRIAVGNFWRRHQAWTAACAAYTAHPADPPEDQAHLWWLTGTCAEEAGAIDDALVAYRALDNRFPATPWAAQGRLAWGQLLERQEQWPEARQLYHRLIDQHPEEARYAQERLDALGPVRRP